MFQRERINWNESGTKVVGTELTDIARQLDLGGLDIKCLWVKNTGPATFTAGSFEISPDGNSWNGHDGTTLRLLGSNVMDRILIKDDTARYARFQASVAFGSVATAMYWWNF